eukprot:3738584-Prymnesium_polylepis.1
MQSLVDTYRCTPWGGAASLPPGGSRVDGVPEAVGQFVKRSSYLKASIGEVRWLARKLAALPAAVGLLITDDANDLNENEVEAIRWMKANTPQLYPWINQCADSSEWVARAGTPYATPELYHVAEAGGWVLNESASAPAKAYEFARDQLASYVNWT